MSKFATILLISNVIIGGLVFSTSYAATHQACESARLAQKIPSNYWVGNLDTPANEAQLSKYCFDVEIGTSSFVTIFVLLMLSTSTTLIYFLLKAKKVI
jgi:hypothetical protein